jgi:hypothetical protein
MYYLAYSPYNFHVPAEVKALKQAPIQVPMFADL